MYRQSLSQSPAGTIVFERTETVYPVMPDQPGYPEWWLRKIVKDTGDKLKVIGE
jgi:hypothetical protein